MDTLRRDRPETATRSRPGRMVVGVLALVVGVVGALGLWLLGEQRYDDGVEALARAPVGCATVVDIDSPGELLVYAEVAGRFDETSGDCAATGVFRADSDAPTVRADVTAPDGTSVPVEAVAGSTYDRGGFRGSQVGRMEVTDTGDHVVRVNSEDGTFALAIGNDPREGVFVLRAGALVALAAGVVIGLVLLVAGRRPPPTPSHGPVPPPEPEWWQTGHTVTAPPQRPAPPRIPGQPPGPGWWDDRGETEQPSRVPGQPPGPGWWDDRVESAEPSRIPGQPPGPGWPGAPDDGDEPSRSPWAPPSV